jgi:uncharacterized RDD family membrane protein YckC
MTERRYGGFWRRLVASAIDMMILYFISLLILLTALIALGLGGGVSLHHVVATGDLPRGMGIYFVVYGFALFVADMIYFIWFHGSVGQTPGKMLLGLRVIQASGEKMTFGVAFLRWVGTLVSTFCLFLGYLWIVVDGRKQGWHDKIAATLVIRTVCEPMPASPPPSAPLPETAIMGQTSAAETLVPADPANRPAAAADCGAIPNPTNPPCQPVPSSDAADAAPPPAGIDATDSVSSGGSEPIGPR